jgi:hypothetical protein
MKLGRNTPCLCGSGRKYKNCCLGKKDWESLIRRPDFTRHLSLRGKNTFFLNSAATILGLDPTDRQIDWSVLKNRVNPEHVGLIHQLVREVWPDGDDLMRILRESGSLSGLYSGTYTPETVMQSLSRHGLYSDAILMFDPFMYPGTVRPEYDPIIHPEKYVSHTIKCLYMWFSLAPWMHSGILKMIRSPADYDRTLRWNSLKAEEQRVEKHPELKEMMDKVKEDVDITAGEIGWATEYFLLSYPDDSVAEMLRSGGFPQDEIDAFMRYRERKKRSHPYYTERRENEMLVTTLGECYGMTRRVADVSGAFLLTDNRVRWKMIEIDRREVGVNESAWEPFAAAMQTAQLKYLDDISLEGCLKLRKDGLLERMRSFLRRVWATARSEDGFSAATAEQFAAELDEEVALAEAEWKEIDANLVKWFAGEAAAALAAAPSIGLANVGWLAASLSLMGIANVTEAELKRRDLPRRMPGAFFMEPRAKRKQNQIPHRTVDPRRVNVR